MNWKFIFNTNHNIGGWKFTDAQKAADEAGYKYFNWNGQILNSFDGTETGIEVKDCF